MTRVPKSKSTREKYMVTVTEKEIVDVLKDKRRFTPVLQIEGILELIEQKRKTR